MEYKINQIDNKCSITINGTLDINTTKDLEKVLLSLDYNNLDLTLDFKDVPYVTSAALRLLLVTRKKLTEKTFRIINVSSDVSNIFKLAGFDTFLNYETLETKQLDFTKENFVSLLRKNAKEVGDKDAYVCEGVHYTWSDIDIASQVFAHKLANAGVNKNSHVGIAAPNSINWIVSFFAIRKLGALAVFINNKLKSTEICGLVKLADIDYICYGNFVKAEDFPIIKKNIVDNCAEIKDVFDISNNVDYLDKNEYENIKELYHEHFNPDDPSIIIFTSGSTSAPKAVLSSSYSQLTCIANTIKEFGLTQDDRNLAFLPCFHVFGFAVNICIELIARYTSYIPISVKPEYLMDLIDKNKITIFSTVPTVILSIVASPSFDPNKVASVRLSILGGSATTQAQMEMLMKTMPNNHMVNVYGMSENALISVTRYNDTIEHTTQTVGKPINDIELQIRSPQGEVLNRNESGELYIKSNAMIVCYYKLELNSQALDDNGYMATGDLAFIDDDGYIHLVGRTKDLIIRGGENISPSEITSALSKLPAIADVKVLGVPNEILGEEVAAAIILNSGQTFDEEQTRTILKQTMASYKVPAYFVIYDTFPMLGNGKIDALTLKKDIVRRINKMQ